MRHIKSYINIRVNYYFFLKLFKHTGTLFYVHPLMLYLTSFGLSLFKNVRRNNMNILRTGRSTNTYKRYTPAQLASTIRQLQKQALIVSKMPTWKRINGKTVTQICTAHVREIKKVATVLRAKTLQLIKVKIRTLRTDYAKKLGVKVSSPRSASPAVKRLNLKIRQINQCRRISTLATFCTGVKLSTFKNPKVSARRTTRTKTTRRTTGKRRTTSRKISSGTHAKYKRQTKSLKKQVHKLQKRNSFMRRLVNQFRRKVAKLQRSYRAANARPRWKVYKGGRTSNVVRFNRGSTWSKQAQRRAG